MVEVFRIVKKIERGIDVCPRNRKKRGGGVERTTNRDFCLFLIKKSDRITNEREDRGKPSHAGSENHG